MKLDHHDAKMLHDKWIAHIKATRPLERIMLKILRGEERGGDEMKFKVGEKVLFRTVKSGVPSVKIGGICGHMKDWKGSPLYFIQPDGEENPFKADGQLSGILIRESDIEPLPASFQKRDEGERKYSQWKDCLSSKSTIEIHVNVEGKKKAIYRMKPWNNRLNLSIKTEYENGPTIGSYLAMPQTFDGHSVEIFGHIFEGVDFYDEEVKS